MLGFLALAILLIAESVTAQNCCKLSVPKQPRDSVLPVADAFKKYGIVGDYISKAPEDLLQVILKTDNCNGCKIAPGTIEMFPGDKLAPAFTIINPQIFYPNSKKGEMYTVILLDIDDPSREKPDGRAYIHGLVVNSPGDNLISGDIVVPYTAASAAAGTGEHRFVAMIYKQTNKLDAKLPDMWRLARERHGFSAEDFAKKYNLVGPVAGNFFLGEMSVC